MTLKQQIEEIRESVKAHDRQIDGLIRAFEAEHRTVGALAASVVHHDAQIEDLRTSIIAHDRQIGELLKATDRNTAQIESLERQLQAYLNRLPPQ